MSNIIKKHYSNFSREILKEFITEKELNRLDKLYTVAKFTRIAKKYAKEIGK